MKKKDMCNRYIKELKENSYIQIILMFAVFMALSYYLLNIPYFASGLLISVIILMCLIGWASPSDIIRNTIDNINKSYGRFPILSKGTLLIGILLMILGSFFIIFGNLKGYSILGFSLLYFSLSYAVMQFYESVKSINKIREIITTNRTQTINSISVENKLKYCRYIFICGCGVIVSAFINYIYNINQDGLFIAMDIAFLGITLLSIGNTIEIDTIYNLFMNQIVYKLKKDYGSK